MGFTKQLEITSADSCLNSAADDEPVFVLRAHDPMAIVAVHWWIQESAVEGLHLDRLAEAREWIKRAREWRAAPRMTESPATPDLRGVAEVNLMEALADAEHASWARWMQYLFSKCDRIDGEAVIPAALEARWQRQVATAYADLTEREKASDRDEVRRILPLINGYVAEARALWEDQQDIMAVSDQENPA